MQTLKTSIVVVLLLAVLYGAYTVINQPPPKLPPEVADMTTDMWDDEPAVAIGTNAASEAGMTAFDSAGNTMPAPRPGLLPADSVTAPPPSQSADTIGAPTPDPTANQQAAAMLTAPQPLSPVDTLDSESPSGDMSPSPSAATPSSVAGVSSTMDAVGSQQPRHHADQHTTVTPPYGNPAGHSPADVAVSESQPAQGAVLANTFRRDWAKGNGFIKEQKYSEALRVLSPYFGSPDLTPAESEQLISLLDPLAGKVIYSREHLVAAAHKIRRDETLYTIAAQYQVPWQLLQKINGVTNPEVLVPGTDLKVIRGPFSAQVDVRRSELTLFMDGMYAGRFPISIGTDFAAQAGEYQVQAKSNERAYYGPNGQVLPPGHPENPYGNAWLNLGGDLAIHGSPQSVPRGTTAAGAISLSPRDASDIYGILSKGSKVSILR